MKIYKFISGLKLQCTDLNLPDIAALCPQLQSLIIQKESPNQVIKVSNNLGICFTGKTNCCEVFTQKIKEG